MLKKILRSPKAYVSIALLMGVLLVALAGPAFAPHNPLSQNLRATLRPPAFLPGGAWTHVLGTDYHGRDVLSRIIHGTRHSLMVASLAVALSAVVGVTVGLIGGYFGGIIDAVLMRLCDVMMAFSPLILGVAVLAIFPPGGATVSVVIALSTWAWFARTIRSSVLRLRELEFVESARSLGANNVRVIGRHIFPSVLPIIIVMATTLLGFAILMEAALSFFGLSGTTLSWGWDIAQGRDFIRQAWWLATAPGLAILVTVMALNSLGDWLRDELDPTVRT